MKKGCVDNRVINFIFILSMIIVLGVLLFALIDKKQGKAYEDEIHCIVSRLFTEQRLENKHYATYYWIVADTTDKKQELRFHVNRNNYDSTSTGEEIIIYKTGKTGKYSNLNYESYRYRNQEITESLTFSNLIVEEKK